MGKRFFRGRNLSLAAAVATVTLAAFIRLGPLPENFLDLSHNVNTVVVDRDGVILYDALSESGTRSKLIDAKTIPPHVERATLAAEDRRFFSHIGVDPIAITRAVWRNTTRRHVVEGGSTITQQTVKLLLARGGKPPARNLWQKLREATLALRLEHRLSKREILALYLNVAPYGNQLIGIERAGRGYFGIRADQLTLAQASFLAGLPQRPTKLDPLRNFDGAVRRQREVLSRLQAPERELAIAKAERLRLVPMPSSLIAPHFVAAVLATTDRKEPRIVTTLDAALQRDVRGIIEARRHELKKHGANNVAVVVLHNRSGEWLAWEGSGDYFDSDHGGAIDGVLAARQPGSTLKPFTYAAAFERGFTPASVLPDVPASFPTAEEGVLYTPRNYDGRFRGPLLARQALAGSINVTAVWLLSKIDSTALLRLMRVSGFTNLDKSADYYGLGLTLGDAEVRLHDLVAAYSVFARGGTWREPKMVKSLKKVEVEKRVLSEKSAYWINDILSDTRAREFVFGSQSALDLPFAAAAKTGTSQAYHDNWTIGYTADVTVGVWVGNFDRKPLRNSTGVTGAAPIFNSVLLAANRRYGNGAAPIATPPSDLHEQQICALSGGRATAACPRVRTEMLPAQLRACSWHIVSSRRDGESMASATRVDWPAEFRLWAERSAPVQPGGEIARRTKRHDVRELAIVSPADGAVYLIDPTLRAAYQTVKLQAIVRGDASHLVWSVDGRRLATKRPSEEVRWSLQPGRHTISVSDGARARHTVEITVK